MSSTSTATTVPGYENLAGTWESPDLEPMPSAEAPHGSQIYIARTFDFQDRAWRVRFSGWADANRRLRLFDGVGEGTFELQDPWAPVSGARAAIFNFSRRLLTVHTHQLARQLTESGAGKASWAPGIQQDVSETGALFVPSLAASSTEYDLLVFDTGRQGERDLYLGDRSYKMNSPANRPVKRIPFPVRKVD